MKNWYEFTNKAGAEAEIKIYNDIGFRIGAEKFLDELGDIDAEEIHVRINSDGGEVFDSFAIFNGLRRHPAKIVVHIDGVAASGASIIAMAGDEIRIAKNAFMMIHNVQGAAIGDQNDMQTMADVLTKLSGALVTMYADRTGAEPRQIQKWMDAETYFSAEEAAEQKFVDEIEDENELAPKKRPTNLASRFWNKAVPRVRVENRLQALGMADLLTPTNAATPENPMITLEQFKEFAAKNSDATKSVAAELIDKAHEEGKALGKTEALTASKPKPATAAELKAAFPNDKDFVMDRLDHDAPMADHKVAFADHLQKKLQTVEGERDTLKNKLTEIDPSHAGTQPVNTPVEQTGGDKPMTAERRRELMGSSPLGQVALRQK